MQPVASPDPSNGVVPLAGVIPPASGGPNVPVRDAATVVLARDSKDGLEVFMLRRNLKSVFVGGAYVFPGGAVDPEDRHAEVADVCAGRTDEQASARLGIREGGLAYWVAAVRECFEEAGVLLALREDQHLISFADPEIERRFAEHWRTIDKGERRLTELCREESLRLATDRMHYFSHWITPIGAPRRYDTRFFVCAAPREQEPLHDDRETIASVWTTPSAALERYRAGEFEMILPTIKTLEAIGRFPTASSLIEAVSGFGEIPTILPRLGSDGEVLIETVSRGAG